VSGDGHGPDARIDFGGAKFIHVLLRDARSPTRSGGAIGRDLIWKKQARQSRVSQRPVVREMIIAFRHAEERSDESNPLFFWRAR